MSTKVYNGYVFEGSIFDLIEKVEKEDLVNKVHALTNTLQIPILANLYASEFFDGEGPEEKSLIEKVREFTINAHIESSVHMSRSPYDFEATLMVKPHPFSKSKVLIGSFVRNKAVESFIVENLDLKNFGYWNNTDPEEGLTSRQWARRGEIWEKALGDKTWNQAGFMSLNFFESKPLDTFLLWDLSSEEFNKQLTEACDRRVDSFILDSLGEMFINHNPELKNSLSTQMRFHKSYKNSLRLNENGLQELHQSFKAKLLDLLPEFNRNEITSFKSISKNNLFEVVKANSYKFLPIMSNSFITKEDY